MGRTKTMVTTLKCALLLVALSAVDANAQSSLQIPLQFDFLNPGARSLALGSAFAALADDATAAFTNPAGLTVLLAPEVSLEVRRRRTKTLFLAGGRLSGLPTARGIDTVAGASYHEAVSSNTDPVFVSFVYPQKTWAVALYRHDLINIGFDLEGQGVFQRFGSTGDSVLDTGRQPPIRASRELHIVGYGVAAAVRLGDQVSLGGGVSVFDFTMDTQLARFAFSPSAPGQSTIFNAADFSQELVRQEQLGSGQSLGATVGIKWTARAPVSVGAVFRIGPSFDFSVVEGSPVTGTFQVPDVFTVGAQYRPFPTLTFVGDYSLVRYAQLQDDFIALQTIYSGKTEQFAIGDVNEWHGGAEYVFSTVPGRPAIRGGLWYDPIHSPTYTSSADADYLDELYTAYLATSENLWHYTFGGGVSLGARLEVNAAADLSNRTRNVSASIVARF